MFSEAGEDAAPEATLDDDTDPTPPDAGPEPSPRRGGHLRIIK
jgi:hypothetical protein